VPGNHSSAVKVDPGALKEHLVNSIAYELKRLVIDHGESRTDRCSV
jgi:hypothetical protein